MMKKIINPFLLLLPVLMLFASCEIASETPDGPANGEAMIEMQFSTPLTYTRAVDPEDDMHTLQVLVFNGTGDDAEFQYRRTAIKKSDNLFRTNLVVANGVTLRFAANASDIISSGAGVLVKGTTWKTIREALVMTGSQNIDVDNDGLPMWGEALNVNIENKEVISIGSIPMLRSVAASELRIVPDAAEFQLEEVWVVYGANKGYLAYHYVTGSGSSLKPTAPYSPADMANASDTKVSGVAVGAQLVEGIYMFDNNADLYNSGASVQPTRLILKGTWKKGEAGAHSTYFPLAFRESGTDTKLKVTRNMKYIIQINSVQGDGYETIDEAKKAEEVNLGYEVLPWDNNGDTEIIINDNYFVSLSTRDMTFPRTAGVTNRLPFSTNYAVSSNAYVYDDVKGQYVQYPTSSSPATVYTDDGVPFCEVYFMQYQRRWVIAAKSVKSFDSASGTDGPNNVGTIRVKIGRIPFEIALSQLDMSPTDWIQNNVEWGSI